MFLPIYSLFYTHFLLLLFIITLRDIRFSSQRQGLSFRDCFITRYSMRSVASFHCLLNAFYLFVHVCARNFAAQKA